MSVRRKQAGKNLSTKSHETTRRKPTKVHVPFVFFRVTSWIKFVPLLISYSRFLSLLSRLAASRAALRGGAALGVNEVDALAEAAERAKRLLNLRAVADDDDGHAVGLQVAVGDAVHVVERDRLYALDVAVEVRVGQIIRDNLLQLRGDLVGRLEASRVAADD